MYHRRCPVHGGPFPRERFEEKGTIHIPDVLVDPSSITWAEVVKKSGGYRTIVGVPLLRQGLPNEPLRIDVGVQEIGRSSDPLAHGINHVRQFTMVRHINKRILASAMERTASSTNRGYSVETSQRSRACLLPICRCCPDVGYLNHIPAQTEQAISEERGAA